MSVATILQFPVQHVCPTCFHACPPDDLSGCRRCGQQYCSDCSWECQCDRDAAEMLSRGDA